MVQGETAPLQLINALRTANRRAEVDVLLLTRGGGSLEDLWCFNDESLAREVAASALPIVSAVGHEVDFTISDFVADVRAPTPSAAAEILSQDSAALYQTLSQQKQRLARAIHQYLQTRTTACFKETTAKCVASTKPHPIAVANVRQTTTSFSA